MYGSQTPVHEGMEDASIDNVALNNLALMSSLCRFTLYYYRKHSVDIFLFSCSKGALCELY